MCMNSQLRLVLFKSESTEGTDAVPVVGTDDVFVLRDSAGITQGVSTVKVDPASPTGRRLKQGTSTRKPSATYRIPIYGIGGTGVPFVVALPKWLSVALRTCGHVNQDAGAGDGIEVNWTPDPVDPRLTDDSGVVSRANRTFTIYDYWGGDGNAASGTKILQKMVGCKVVAMRINMTVGQWVVIEIDVQGLWVLPASVTTDISGFDLDGAVSQFVVPNGVASVLTLPEPTKVGLKAQSTVWSLDFQGEQIEGDDLGSGVSCVTLGAPIITATCNPVVAAANIALWETTIRDQGLAAYSLTNALTPQGENPDTGYTFDISVPQVQFVGEYDRGSNTVRKALQLDATSSDGDASEFTLVLT